MLPVEEHKRDSQGLELCREFCEVEKIRSAAFLEQAT